MRKLVYCPSIVAESWNDAESKLKLTGADTTKLRGPYVDVVVRFYNSDAETWNFAEYLASVSVLCGSGIDWDSASSAEATLLALCIVPVVGVCKVSSKL